MFMVTRWTVVLAASRTLSPESAAALERLCSSYWYPLYAFVRRSGYSPEDAEDLTQEFFARLLEHNWIAHADRHKGRFRSFLLMAMKRFLAKEWDKAKAIKRGGQARLVPLKFETAESRYTRELADTRTPEQLFEKQ
jgi:RNA polymerase sigma-70 factor (ECF subfamily)